MSEGWLWRVGQEERDLSRKIDRLAEFIRTPDFLTVTPDHQDLLRRQHMHMCDYRLTLRERIALAYSEQDAPENDSETGQKA